MAPEDHPEEAPVTPNWSLGGNPDQGRQDIAMPSRMAKVKPSVIHKHLIIYSEPQFFRQLKLTVFNVFIFKDY